MCRIVAELVTCRIAAALVADVYDSGGVSDVQVSWSVDRCIG